MATRWKCNRWIFPLMAACGLVLYIAVFVLPRLNIIDASEISSHASNPDQDVRETDRNFLNELVRENNRDDHGSGNPVLIPEANGVNARTIADNLKAIPRAESVKNTEKERPKVKVGRGESPSSSVRPK